jgi:hypothetical protein
MDKKLSRFWKINCANSYLLKNSLAGLTWNRPVQAHSFSLSGDLTITAWQEKKVSAAICQPIRAE